jgi:hypothetical protein
MIVPFRNHLTQLASTKSRPALWLATSLLIAISLVFAGFPFAVSAQAQGTNADEVAADSSAGGGVPENGVSSEQTPLAAEEALPAGAEVPAAAEQTSAEQTPPDPEGVDASAEQAPSSDEQAPSSDEQAPSSDEQAPPSDEQAPPSDEQTPLPVEQTPPVDEQVSIEETPPVARETPPTSHDPETVEQTGGASGETSSEGGATEGAGNSQTPTGASGSNHREPTNEVAPAPFTAATAPSAAMAMPGISTPAAGDNRVSLPPGAPTAPARRAQQVRRELAAFGAWTIATSYDGRWLDTPGGSLVSTTLAFATVGASPAAMAAASAPAHGKGDASSIENHPFSPMPGSGGGGGGSAAGGASGAGSSASFTLVGVPLQTASNVMRLLCVSQPSWRTTFFALIPERPD